MGRQDRTAVKRRFKRKKGKGKRKRQRNGKGKGREREGKGKGKRSQVLARYSLLITYYVLVREA